MLAFIHIPKTGGTTLATMLREHRQRVVDVNTLEEALALGAEDPSTFADNDAITGHMPVSITDLFPNIRLAAFVRDPVERAISSYAHVLRTPEHPLHERVHQGVSIMDYLEIDAGVTNGQVARLGTYPFLDQRDEGGNYWWQRTHHRIDAGALRDAKANLSRCAFIGLYEEFERDARAFCQMFGLPIPQDVPRLNFAPDPMEIDLRTRLALADMNAADYELYLYARYLIEERGASAGAIAL